MNVVGSFRGWAEIYSIYPKGETCKHTREEKEKREGELREEREKPKKKKEKLNGGEWERE